MVGFMKSIKNVFGIKGEEISAEGLDLDQFLQELPAQMGYDVQFRRVETDNGEIHYEVEGPEMDSFLGSNCEMLDALAHVSMRVLRRKEGFSNAKVGEEGESTFRVTFDADGFRQEKADELKELAESQRQKVLDSGGKPAYIKALGPSERKIIHTHLADLGEVTSESIGRGNFKRIRIKLVDGSSYRKEGVSAEGGDGSGSRRSSRGGRGNGRGNGSRRGGGPSRGGRGGRGGGRGRGGPREDVNGNLIRNEQDDLPPDNIGNRLAPGEEPIFSYNSEADKPNS